MKLLSIPLLCKERPGEVESMCHRDAMTGSGIEGYQEAISPPLFGGGVLKGASVARKGGGHQNPQLYVLLMPRSEELLIDCGLLFRSLTPFFCTNTPRKPFFYENSFSIFLQFFQIRVR